MEIIDSSPQYQLQFREDSVFKEISHGYDSKQCSVYEIETRDKLENLFKESNDIALLLLGKTGEGKSSTGNSILDMEMFNTSDFLVSVNNHLGNAKTLFHDRIIEVTDSTGFEDADNLNELETSDEIVVQSVQNAFQQHPQGYHAFTIVFRYGTRFRREDKLFIEMLKDMFGYTTVKNYGILLLTHGDVFRSQPSNKTKKFKTWCHEQTGVFKELLEECGQRAVLFDNNTDYPIIKNKQRTKLLKMIDQLHNNGRRYRDDHFQAAQVRRRFLKMKHQVERIAEDSRIEVNNFLHEIINIDTLGTDKQLEELNKLSEKCRILEFKIETEEQGKNMFINAKSLLSSMNETINLRFLTAKRIEEKTKLEQFSIELKNKYDVEFQKFKEESMSIVNENEKIRKKLEETNQSITYFQNKVSDLKMEYKTQHSLDILLLGKTGNGKSSTGNTILGEEIFEIGDDWKSITKVLQSGKTDFHGRTIEVVDGPGFQDTSTMEDLEESTLMMIDIMKDANLQHPQGYHAFLIVLRYGARFTHEDKAIILMLKDIFGETVVKLYSILVLTHGDVFRSHKTNKNKKFKTWCNEQIGVFKELFDECGKRAVLFDNNTEDTKMKYKQMKKLIHKIDTLQYQDRRYHDDHFKAAEERRHKLAMKYKVKRITEDTRKKS